MYLIGFGTRPEWLKLKSLVQELEDNKVPYRLLFTGQHNSLIPDEAKPYITDSISYTDYSKNRLDSILTNIFMYCSTLNWKDVKLVLVQGDTTSALGVALSAFHNKIPIAHIEAGLRTFDLNNPYPEEFNRTTIDLISDILFFPTEKAYTNTLPGMRRNQRGYIVGNTIIDILPKIPPETGDYSLLTLHRRENWKLLASWLIEIDNHTKNKVLFPTHPSVVNNVKNLNLKNIQLLDSVNHSTFCNLLAKCRYVITDSGGVQEEATYYKKTIVVCREETERTEAEKFILNAKTPADIGPILLKLSHNQYNLTVDLECPFGKGDSAKKIVQILNNIV